MVSADGAMICVVLNVETCLKIIILMKTTQYIFPLVSYLTNESHMETHNKAERERVKVVVVTVHFHSEEREYEVNSLDVKVPRSKRLGAWQNFVDAITELHKVRVILRSVVHRLVQSLERGLQTVVGKISTVVRYESLRSIAARECLWLGVRLSVTF